MESMMIIHKVFKDKRKEIIAIISELSPIKQQQVIKNLDELIKITISACHN